MTRIFQQAGGLKLLEILIQNRERFFTSLLRVNNSRVDDWSMNHKQTKLDELDHAVTNIKTDLRCGLRLAKVAELVTGSTINSNMRVPAVSRLQKVHNTDVALAAYKEGGLNIPNSIAVEDIVAGHMEKILTLLWTIIFG